MRRTLRSFAFAGRGLALAFRGPNLRLQSAVGYAACALAWLEGLGPEAVALVALAAGLVLAFEVVNTSVEELADLAAGGWRPEAARAKDLAAGAVLVAAAAAFAAGLALLGPRLGRVPGALAQLLSASPGGFAALVAGWLLLVGLWLTAPRGKGGDR
ncbi:MAG: diacylglycerol kinase family protein [Clostridia bacterium]|nr:diacylglycerol kinase family protein [Clostridia bacterium]